MQAGLPDASEAVSDLSIEAKSMGAHRVMLAETGAFDFVKTQSVAELAN